MGAWKCPRGASSRARVAFPRHTRSDVGMPSTQPNFPAVAAKLIAARRGLVWPPLEHSTEPQCRAPPQVKFGRPPKAYPGMRYTMRGHRVSWCSQAQRLGKKPGPCQLQGAVPWVEGRRERQGAAGVMARGICISMTATAAPRIGRAQNMATSRQWATAQGRPGPMGGSGDRPSPGPSGVGLAGGAIEHRRVPLIWPLRVPLEDHNQPPGRTSFLKID